MNRNFVVVLCLAVPSMVAFCSVYAEAIPKEGAYDYTVCFTRVRSRIDYSKSQFGYSYEESGEAVAKVSGTLFDGEKVRCVGMTISLDGKPSGGSLCEGIDKGGDKRLTRFWYDNDGKYQREQVSGTGKYAGMTTTGSVVASAPPEEIKPGTVKICNHATGTYRLK